ncbi:hypothetical protein EDB84DRAFT_1435695 [Lactarius hengduanensis]|nr:hypothetical protein EDB84DRAFT_1435695 [Lactarius hengduanensis]
MAALRAVLRRRGRSAGSCVTWRGLGAPCWVGVAGSCAPRRGGVGVGGGYLACRVEAAWRGLGACWVGVVVSRPVAGSCAPCRGGVEVGGGWALRAALRWVGGRGVACRVGAAVAGCREPCRGGVLGRGRVEMTRVLEGAAMACNVQGLACRVGAARQVGGGRVLGQGRMEVARVHEGAAMACNAQGLACCVGAAWRVGGGGVLGQGRMEVTRVHEGATMACNARVSGKKKKKKKKLILLCWGGVAGWRWWRVASHVGTACRGGDEVARVDEGGAMACNVQGDGEKEKEKKKKRGKHILMHWASSQASLERPDEGWKWEQYWWRGYVAARLSQKIGSSGGLICGVGICVVDKHS